MRSLAYEGLVVGKKNSGHYRGWTASKRTLSRVDCTNLAEHAARHVTSHLPWDVMRVLHHVGTRKQSADERDGEKKAGIISRTCLDYI